MIDRTESHRADQSAGDDAWGMPQGMHGSFTSGGGAGLRPAIDALFFAQDP